MSRLHFVPSLPVLDRDVDELAEASPARVVGRARALPVQREPHLALVGSIQAELGIREPQWFGDHGPTSRLSEDLLWRGYGLADEEAG